MVAYFVAMVFCGIPIFFAGNQNIMVVRRYFRASFAPFGYLFDWYTCLYCFHLAEVALGQYLGVGGMTFIGQIVPIMKGK